MKTLKYNKKRQIHKIRVYKTMTKTVLMYGSEIRAMTKKVKRNVKIAEIVFLLSVTGVSLLDLKGSADIEKELRNRVLVHPVLVFMKLN
jgi:predicted amino acid racemase